MVSSIWFEASQALFDPLPIVDSVLCNCGSRGLCLWDGTAIAHLSVILEQTQEFPFPQFHFVLFQLLQQAVLFRLCRSSRILHRLTLLRAHGYLLLVLVRRFKDKGDSRTGSDSDGCQNSGQAHSTGAPHFVSKGRRAHGHDVAFLDLQEQRTQNKSECLHCSILVFCLTASWLLSRSPAMIVAVGSVPACRWGHTVRSYYYRRSYLPRPGGIALGCERFYVDIASVVLIQDHTQGTH